MQSGKGGDIMPLSVMVGDKRLSINKDIKTKCLDSMREELKENGIQVEAIDLVLLGMAIAFTEQGDRIAPQDCEGIGDGTSEKTMIMSLNRLSDEQLGTMIALAVHKLVSTDTLKDMDKIVEIWEAMAEEGLKKLYCHHFLDFSSGRPNITAFFESIYNLIEN